MKYFYLIILPVFISTGLHAQDSLETKSFSDHFTLDIHGGALWYPLGDYAVPFNLHMSPGVRLTKHIALTGSYAFFGAEGEYVSRRFEGYGLGLRYDRYPVMLKAEVIQLTRYQDFTEWDSWRLRDRKNLNPMARLHIGFRVAPRFIAGLTIAHFRNVKVVGYNYSSDRGDWTTFRKNLNETSLQLFFGLSLGKRTKLSN